jgi:glycosyltransferase involved in cell wall biosynthesis
MAKISIIVPAFNEEKFLGNCLLSLREQEFKDFEIIVVDNNSTDKTVEIAKKFGAILVSEKKQGVAFARNKGAKVAKGEVLAFTDADTILPKNWLSRIKKEFEKDKELVAFGGSCEFYSGPISARLASKFLLKPFLILDKFFSGGFNLMGCNMAIKREAFLRVGGFNENLKLNEDVEISYRLREIGKVKIDLNFKVKTSGRRFSRGLIFGIANYTPTTIFRWFFKKFDKFQIFSSQRKEESFVGNFSFLLSLFLIVFLFFYCSKPKIAIAKNIIRKDLNKMVFIERKFKCKFENEFRKVKNLPHLRRRTKRIYLKEP